VKHCIKPAGTDTKFPLSLDQSVLAHPKVRIIGYVSAASSTNDLLELVPEEFHKFLDIMGKEAADVLPKDSSYDHEILLKEGEKPPWGPIYPLSEVELETLREYLKEMMRTGKIQRSTSSAGAPILFVPKPHGRGLRLCVDYGGINRITIPNRYPLPLIQELQDRIQGAQFFTKIDLKNGDHLVRMKEGEEWKTAFRTHYGLYEFLVMPFGLTNALATFQDMINHIFRDMTDFGLLAYIDDLLIYAKTEGERDKIVKEVLRWLRANRLAVSAEKCSWKQPEVEFLGYVIGREGIKMSEEKVKGVLEWKSPASLVETQAFLGFANFYQRFIKDYSRIARPITELTKATTKDWRWTPEAEQIFTELKNRFTSTPILAHFDPQRPVIVETDASDFTLGAVLSQRDDENRVHPVAFHSRKFASTEINYEIHDKELLAIVDSFKYWRRYLEGAAHQVQVFSNHQNLEYFTTTKVLNRRQARWAQELASIDFKIYYRSGIKNGKPDALSRRSEYRLEKGGCESQPITTVLHKKHFAGTVNTVREGMAFIISAEQLYSLLARSWKKEFLALIRSAGEKDPEYHKALEELKKEEKREDKEAEENGEAARATRVPNDQEAEENREAVRAGPVPNDREAKENGEAAQARPVPDGREAEENGKAARVGPVPDGREAGEDREAAGPGLNGRVTKDRKEARTGKGMIEMKDGCVYRKGMLWIPNDRNLIRQILESEHDTKVAGYMGQDKTIELI